MQMFAILFPATKCPAAEVFDGGEPSEGGERFVPPMERQQAALLQPGGFQFLKRCGQQLTMPDQRETEGIFGFLPGQTRSGIEEGRLFDPLGKFFRCGDQLSSDVEQLLAGRQRMFEDDEQFFEFEWELHEWSEDHHEGPLVFSLL